MQPPEQQHPTDTNLDPTDASWKRLYRVAAIAALLVVLMALGDIVTMFFESKVAVPGAVSAVGWFTQLHENRLLGLRNLGLLNIINLLLELPLFLALYHVHRRVDRAFAALAMLLLVIGASVYISRNTVFSLDALSLQYAAATTEAQRAGLAAAGQALLAFGEDLTPGMFMGFFLTELAGLVMAMVMLGGLIFGRPTAVLGIVGFGALLVFNIFAAFVPGNYGVVVGLGGLGGMLMIVWFVLVARRLFRLAAPGPRRRGDF